MQKRPERSIATHKTELHPETPAAMSGCQAQLSIHRSMVRELHGGKFCILCPAATRGPLQKGGVVQNDGSHAPPRATKREERAAVTSLRDWLSEVPRETQGAVIIDLRERHCASNRLLSQMPRATLIALCLLLDNVYSTRESRRTVKDRMGGRNGRSAIRRDG